MRVSVCEPNCELQTSHGELYKYALKARSIYLPVRFGVGGLRCVLAPASECKRESRLQISSLAVCSRRVIKLPTQTIRLADADHGSPENQKLLIG